MSEDGLKKIISHAKEYGFVFPSSEIYDGLSAAYDYGQLGSELKNNIKQYWWTAMVRMNENIVGIDAAIFMHPTTWKASGHVDAFNDPLIDNKDSKKRYRADVLIEEHIAKIEAKINKDVTKAKKRFGDDFDEAQFRSTNPQVLRRQGDIDGINARFKAAMDAEDLAAVKTLIEDLGITCPVSGSKNWTDVRQFNLMFKTELGAVSGDSGVVYLRPETAQGIFVNYLNVQKSGRMKLPFGIAQIGKAFRNEIIARQFIFRMREFEQMEMQFFIKPGTQESGTTTGKKPESSGTRPSASARRTTASTTTSSWPTTPTPRATSSSTSPWASKSSKASTRGRILTSSNTKSSATRSCATSTPRRRRATCPTCSRPPLASTACSSPSSAAPSARRRSKTAARAR